MRKALLLAVTCALFALPLSSVAGERFDGKWLTKMACPAKGNTQGYTWTFVSTIQAGTLHGERGTAGEGGYFTLDGKIKDDGSSKLDANGIVASRQYARGVFASKGEEYGYKVKAQFTETTGTGTRDVGMGIVGRPCTFEFTKQ
jgi:hypothetical protein